MEDKIKIIITDDHGNISVDVINKNEWLTVTESGLPKSGLSIFGMCKLIVSALKKELQENGNSRNKSIEGAKVR